MPRATLYAHWGWWLLGFVLLLALCDDDDEEYCYTFGAEQACFQKPLPKDADCYLTATRDVQCFDKPLK